MNIIFAGTPEFTIPTLEALLNSPHQLIAILTQPDKPAGRGQKLMASAVKTWALEHHIRVMQPTTLREINIQNQLRDLKPDVMVVAAYGLLLPPDVLSIPRFGCINIHGSLLPRWRGASPIQSAILHGDKTTGVTIMQMDRGMDSGAMLHKTSTNINANDNSQTLHDRLAIMGASALMETLKNIDALKPEMQNETLVTFAPKISKEQARIDWRKNAITIDRLIRAFNPWPVAHTLLATTTLIRILEASVICEKTMAAPGTIIRVNKEGIDVATGEHILRIKKLQLPGARALPVSDILNSKKDLFHIGAVFSND